MKLSLILLCMLALSVPVLSMNRSTGGNSSGGDELKPMPAIKLQDLNGKDEAPDQFKNNVVLFDFWATWCGPCIAEIPFLNRLQEKYGAEGLKVVGVTLLSGDAKEVKPFVSRFKMGYSILMGDDNQAYDLNIIGFPTTYLVSRDWKIFRKYVGAGPAKNQQMEADIKQLLEQKAQK
jgi:thiol-disulfide isomerase/thioredoxin